MTVIAFGDWHGDRNYALSALCRAADLYPEVDNYVHVGDFGVWVSGDQPIGSEVFSSTGDIEQDWDEWARSGKCYGYMADIDETLRRLGKKLHVVLGNHEDYWNLEDRYGFVGFFSPTGPTPGGSMGVAQPKLYGDPETGFTDDRGFIMSPFYTNIVIIPRTHVWEWDGVRYGSIGGACSIDILSRTKGVSWWPEEQPTMEQAGTLANTNVDILFTHDAPREITDEMYPAGGGGWPSKALDWAAQSPPVISEAARLSGAKRVVCGHHHVRWDTGYGSTEVSFIADNEASLMDNRVYLSD